MDNEDKHIIKNNSLLEVYFLFKILYEDEIKKIPAKIWARIAKMTSRNFEKLNSKQIIILFLAPETIIPGQDNYTQRFSNDERESISNVLKYRLSEDAIYVHAYLRARYIGFDGITDDLEKEIIKSISYDEVINNRYPQLL